MASSQNGNLGVWSGYTPGDNGWTSQHNTNWDALDALVQPWVISNALTTPPGSPSNGDAYIVPGGATGAWASQTNKIAAWQRGAWAFYTPKNGWQVYNRLDGGDYLYNGTAWVLQGSQKLNVPQDYISGLKMVWNSATSISVTSGSAFVPSLGRLVQPAATLTLSSLSLSTSTWYHVYLYENAGTPAIECVSTAPAAAYYGTARTKTSDTSRRYIGSVRTDASGNIFNFYQIGNRIQYRFNYALAARILANGQATTQTTVDASSFVPTTSRALMAKFLNTDSAQVVKLYAYHDAASPSFIQIINVEVAPAGCTFTFVLDFVLSPTQTLQYAFGSAPTGGLSCDVASYTYER